MINLVRVNLIVILGKFMPNRKLLAVAIAGIITCGYFISSHDSQSLVTNNVAAQQAGAINEQIYSQSNILFPAHALPASLADIKHGVVLQADENGNLIVNSDTHDLFEFYLSAMGEEPLEQILIRIRHDIEQQLAFAAKDQAFLLLKKFINYKIELSSLSTDLKNQASGESYGLESLKLQKAQVSSLRAHYFSPSTYQAFFQQEEGYDNFMLSQLEINQNPHLNAVQKRQQLDTLLDQLPEEIKRVRHTVSRHGELFQAARDMRSYGASNEEIYQLRASSLGDQAATALAELDVKRDLWQQRLSHYAQQRDAILTSGLSDTDRLQAIDALINLNFSQPEIVRVKALDHTL